MSKAKVGKRSQIAKTAVIGMRTLRRGHGGPVAIGEGATVLPGAIVYENVRIGRDAIIAHYAIIREETVIGDRFRLWNHSVVDYGCRIGDDVKVHCRVYLAQGTVVEDGVFIGPGTVTANDPHPGSPHGGSCLRGPVIRQGANLGAGVTVLPGVTIGARALVGAGSVVTRDVPEDAVVVGNPARPIKTIQDIQCATPGLGAPYPSRSTRRVSPVRAYPQKAAR